MSKVGKAKLKNLGRALDRLEEAVARKRKDQLQIDGTIQRFEFCFSLCWKTLKYILEEDGDKTLMTTPGAVFREALSTGLLQDKAVWEQMLLDRNDTSHVYDEAKAREIHGRVPSYYKGMRRAEKQMAKLCKAMRKA